jgi:hypothetical protein
MKPTRKTPTMPWTGAMLEVDPDSGAVVGLAVVAGDTDTEETINATIDRILPGWREAAGLLNPTQRSEP